MDFYQAMMARYREVYRDPRVRVTRGLLRKMLTELQQGEAFYLETRFGRYDRRNKSIEHTARVMGVGKAGAVTLENRSLNSLKLLFDKEGQGQTGRPIFTLGLSQRTQNALTRRGIVTVEDLLTYSAADLLAFRNFGPGFLEEVKAALLKRKLYLRS